MDNTFFPRHDLHGAMGNTDADASSSSSSSHDSHDSMSGGMHMFFQTAQATPLFASSWTPNSTGAYAGTCIFLIVLAVIGRCLLAARSIQEARWLDRDAKRRYIAANGKVPLAEQISQDREKKEMTLSENGVEESVFVVERKRGVVRPWRFSVDPVRAVLDTIIAGVGYLL